MSNLTIIYYTSNKEGEVFEQRIRDTILRNSHNLPIISVSQKPIDFGHNICVGEVGVSGFNMFRQIEIACKVAKTPFVISCEADCLYPEEYFNFFPGKLDVCYRNTNLYVMGQWRSYFYKKNEGATHAQVIGRQYYLDTLSNLFAGAPLWSEEERNFPKERNGMNDIFSKDQIFRYQGKEPVVQIKTTRSMRHYTHSNRTPINSIPYWGEGKEFRKKYYADH